MKSDSLAALAESFSALFPLLGPLDAHCGHWCVMSPLLLFFTQDIRFNPGQHLAIRRRFEFSLKVILRAGGHLLRRAIPQEFRFFFVLGNG